LQIQISIVTNYFYANPNLREVANLQQVSVGFSGSKLSQFGLMISKPVTNLREISNLPQV